MTKAHEYLEYAERDIMSAQQALKMEEPDLDNGSFHTQQAAEKGVTAVLAAEGIPFPKTHRIGRLAALLPEGHKLKAPADALDRLTPLTEAGRYPLMDPGTPASVLSEKDLAATIAELKRFAKQIAGGLEKPRSSFVRSLQRERPERPMKRNQASLYVTRRQIYDALSQAAPADQSTAALRSLIPATRQAGRERIAGAMRKTGDTHVGRDGVEHLYRRMSKRPMEKAALLTLDAIEADMIVRCERHLTQGFKTLADKSEALSRDPNTLA